MEICVREALGADLFRQAWEDGRAMGLEEAVAYALQDSSAGPHDAIHRVG
ncbi:MAG: hypothetical protein JOZ41_08850 [Chloroflexi bacterium]|nr:hypothetical protein [Chloroflexota bacterium]